MVDFAGPYGVHGPGPKPAGRRVRRVGRAPWAGRAGRQVGPVELADGSGGGQTRRAGRVGTRVGTRVGPAHRAGRSAIPLTCAWVPWSLYEGPTGPM
jgi:hypothetical protein